MRDWAPKAAAIDRAEALRQAAWVDRQVCDMPQREAARVLAAHRRGGGVESAAANRLLLLESEIAAVLRLLPDRWAGHLRGELRRAGGVGNAVAVGRVLSTGEEAGGRLSLGASDEEIRAAAKEAAEEAAALVSVAPGGGLAAARWLLAKHCAKWGVEAPDCRDDGPAVRRMLCARWYLRRLRRAHVRRAEGVAIRAGLVRRGLWIYSSQDAVERRQAQRARNALAIDRASVCCLETGEDIDLAGVVAASVANPEVKRAELMTRVKGCDAVAADRGCACEFWTLTAPGRMHAQRIVGGVAVVNDRFDGTTPKEAQAYLSKVWARARAAWKRRGLEVFGLRTAEPHHDGTPHWHLIAYGRRRELRFARRLLRVYALREAPDEEGAREHRFKVLEARAGTRGAAYAAKYVSKNIDGKGLDGQIDAEGERKISASVRRVDAWAAAWGIRQFQFFGTPAITAWRVLRRMRSPVALPGSALERARVAADDGDFAEFWRACEAGPIAISYRSVDRETAYGDPAQPKVVGVEEGGRRAELPEKTWVISWAGVKTRLDETIFKVFSAVDRGKSATMPGGFGFPRSCVNNCTGSGDFSSAVVGALGADDFSRWWPG